MTKILVVGGAGYIGSHVVKALGAKGYDVATVDNLSTGFRDAVLYGRFYKCDLLDKDCLKDIIAREKPDAVMHFAALIIVPESVEEPLLYYNNNITGTINLLNAMHELGVDKLIFSSTAAVYGIPGVIPIKEGTGLAPINPYGHSKAMMEQVMNDCAAAWGLRYVALRYFNVAGADPEGQLGERKESATHLITVATRVAHGRLPALKIFGTDYDTPDGTCIRDYIHVSDLAEAHVAALRYLLQGGESSIFNCGYGRGASVLEVLDAVRRVTGNSFKVEPAARRAGDPPALVADSARIKIKLGWESKHDDLDFIIKTAWEWEQKRIN
jgi:UDP-glucose 4-epimerase